MVFLELGNIFVYMFIAWICLYMLYLSPYKLILVEIEKGNQDRFLAVTSVNFWEKSVKYFDPIFFIHVVL